MGDVGGGVDGSRNAFFSGDVFGGFVKGNGNTNNNKVSITNTTVDGAARGENDFSENVFSGNVCGSFVKGSGNTNNNLVLVNADATVNGDAFGSYVGGDGTTENNIVTIDGNGEIKGNVCGSFVKGSGNTNNNKVLVKAGATVNGDVLGSHVGEGNGKISSSTVILDGGNVKGNVCGSFVGGNGNATRNTVLIAKTPPGFGNNTILCGSSHYHAKDGSDASASSSSPNSPSQSAPSLSPNSPSQSNSSPSLNGSNTPTDNNTLIVRAPIAVERIVNFQNLIIHLPEDARNSQEPVLTIRNGGCCSRNKAKSDNDGHPDTLDSSSSSSFSSSTPSQSAPSLSPDSPSQSDPSFSSFSSSTPSQSSSSARSSSSSSSFSSSTPSQSAPSLSSSSSSTSSQSSSSSSSSSSSQNSSSLSAPSSSSFSSSTPSQSSSNASSSSSSSSSLDEDKPSPLDLSGTRIIIILPGEVGLEIIDKGYMLICSQKGFKMEAANNSTFPLFLAKEGGRIVNEDLTVSEDLIVHEGLEWSVEIVNETGLQVTLRRKNNTLAAGAGAGAGDREDGAGGGETGGIDADEAVETGAGDREDGAGGGAGAGAVPDRSSSANKNEVKITNTTVHVAANSRKFNSGNVLGGYVNGDGDANDNEVTITDATVGAPPPDDPGYIPPTLAQGHGTAILLVNDGLDCVLKTMEEPEGLPDKCKNHIEAFAGTSLCSLNYNTDKTNPQETKTNSVVAGARVTLELGGKDLTTAIFGEYGTGTSKMECYKDSSNAKSSCMGGGLFAKYDLYKESVGQEMYGELALTAGQTRNDFDGTINNAEVKYKDSKNIYEGFELGIGHKHKINKDIKLEENLRYMFTHGNKKDQELIKQRTIEFDSVMSNRIKIGAKGTYTGMVLKPY